MSFEARLRELGMTLPGPFPPHDPLDGVVVHRRTARTSGCLPRTAEGDLRATGTLGVDVTTADGVECAALCVQNALSLLRAELGGLDGIERALTMTVFMACTEAFVEQPAVADGASQVLVDVFGAAGRHTRSAIGVAALPRGAPVEVELTVALLSR
ncbi:MAG TPA: RidA family protein [Acidimicrobiia bacterium]|jgi:enamine deaminase RidA (YjgF/YER057c/UK114 family)